MTDIKQNPPYNLGVAHIFDNELQQYVGNAWGMTMIREMESIVEYLNENIQSALMVTTIDKMLRDDEIRFFTEEDIGKAVTIGFEGLTIQDTVEELLMPDGKVIYGPRLKLSRVFACLLCHDSMVEWNAIQRQKLEDGA
tara:strand:+ start:1493 stop:1909 length:417 start_codon:yes stop_codon:yes gene_type:complete